jgi:phenylacetic acid degradation operon negative regulatory protein
MQAARFDDLVADMRGAQPPRVWSLLVTVFGDLAQDGSDISAGVLGQIVAAIGIRPEAMRVALHRLRKDGWIDSQRRGRSSVYALSGQGRAESAAASPRIYAAKGPPAEAAWLVLTDPSGPPDTTTSGQFMIAPNVLLSSTPPQGKDVFVTRIGADRRLPDWMRERICDPAITRLSQDLAARLHRLRHALPAAAEHGHGHGGLDPVQQAVLRVLIVHEWRRIVLKAPALPDALFPQGWAGADCRAQVGHLLDRLPRQTPDDLERVLGRA